MKPIEADIFEKLSDTEEYNGSVFLSDGVPRVGDQIHYYGNNGGWRDKSVTRVSWQYNMQGELSVVFIHVD